MEAPFIKPINAGIRLATMLIDHVFMCIIIVLFFIPSLLSTMTAGFTNPHEPVAPDLVGSTRYIAFLGFALYFCKDMIGGRSLAKRILKLQVVDHSTGRAATPLQCLVRNFFLPFWFVEGFVALANPARRIGDRVAGTRLARYEPGSVASPIPWGNLVASLVISFGLFLSLAWIIPKPKFVKPEWSETSYNKPVSRELERMIKKDLGEYMTPDVRVYDTMRNTPLKYVSVVLNLKEDYMSESENYSLLSSQVAGIVYSRIPYEELTGQLRFVYKITGYQNTITGPLGTPLKTKK